MASNPAYERVDSEPNTPARGPPWWASALLFDVDEAPMLEKRQIVMNVCLTQIVLSFVVSLVNFKRSGEAICFLRQPIEEHSAVDRTPHHHSRQRRWPRAAARWRGRAPRAAMMRSSSQVSSG